MKKAVTLGVARRAQESESGRRRPAGVVGALVLLGLTLGALGHVAVHLKNFEVGYALGKERKARVELEEDRRKLAIEVGMLKDPGRIMILARDKLGLAPPAPDAILTPTDLAARAANPLPVASAPLPGASKGGP